MCPRADIIFGAGRKEGGAEKFLTDQNLDRVHTHNATPGR